MSLIEGSKTEEVKGPTNTMKEHTSISNRNSILEKVENVLVPENSRIYSSMNFLLKSSENSSKFKDLL